MRNTSKHEIIAGKIEKQFFQIMKRSSSDSLSENQHQVMLNKACICKISLALRHHQQPQLI